MLRVQMHGFLAIPYYSRECVTANVLLKMLFWYGYYVKLEMVLVHDERGGQACKNESFSCVTPLFKKKTCILEVLS